MSRPFSIRAVLLIACLAGVGAPRPASAYNECGAQTRAIGSACGATPTICTFDDFQAYARCATDTHIYTTDGRHTRSSAPTTSWRLTDYYGYQCVELALRYFYGRWLVPNWSVRNAAAMCNGSLPAHVTRISNPTAADVVPGDLMVFPPNGCGGAGADGHVAVVNSIIGANAELINQNCLINNTLVTCVTRHSVADCAACIIHADYNAPVCKTIGLPPEDPPALPEEGLCFACGDSMRDEAEPGWVDWADFRYKAACSPTQAATGLSMSNTGVLKYAHDLLCRLDRPDTFLRTSCHEVVFDADDNRPTADGEDWDPGYYKGECAPDEYVVGISQTINLALFSIRCCQGAVAHDDCSAVVFADESDFDGSEMINDWDPDYNKGECAPGRFIAGVSQRPGTGEPHAILCCGERESPPDDGGDAGADDGDGGEVSDGTGPDADGAPPGDEETSGDVEADDGGVRSLEGQGCSCRATGAAGAGGWIWMACAALCLRRRRDRRSGGAPGKATTVT